MSEAALSLENVTAGYLGHLPVVKEITFDVQPGETFGLIGLNGAGKTTMVKAILGMRSQQEGTINIYGKPSSLKDSRKRLAFLPERFEPPWFLNGMEFVKFSLELYKHSFNEEAVYEAAEKIALDTDALKRRVQTYSKGMRQKLGLIATFLTPCDLLILDEPMSGLDPKARALVKKMFVEKGAVPNRTIFLSSHILSDMDEICDRVTVLDQAELKFIGSPKDFKSQMKVKDMERAFLKLIEVRKAA